LHEKPGKRLMNLNQARRVMLSMIVLLSSPSWCSEYDVSFSLAEAENIALARSPELKSYQAKTEEFKQKSIAVNQLPDPHLRLGTINVPVDTFNFSQSPMTMIQVWLEQDFPRGKTLKYRAEQARDFSSVEVQKKEVMKLQILQSVRSSWLETYYWLQAEKIVQKQKVIFDHLLRVTESMLANNKAQQKDVIRAQLELTELEDRLLSIEQALVTARSELARWVGDTRASRALPTQLPVWPSPEVVTELQSSMKQHPVLKTDSALVLANRAEVRLAEQNYKPEFKTELAYDFRQGVNFDGRKRSDFITAQVRVDLPLFPGNRQDRTLKARQENLSSSREDQISHYRALKEVLDKQNIAWKQHNKRASLYKQSLIPEAKQYAEATMTAYQNALTDFPTLARAYVRELDTELAGLRVNIDRDLARINLLYLQGK
jgi:outer membrane protein TolC